MTLPNALLMDPCNFVDYPTGGQLSFAQQLMKACANRWALVGISTDTTPVGQWVDKEFNGISFKFFSIGRLHTQTHRPLIPARVSILMRMWRYRQAIHGLGVHHVFTQSPEMLLAIHNLPWDSICYCFAGAESPLRRPRYAWGKLLAPLFEKWWWRALNRADVLLAAADPCAIETFTQSRQQARQGPPITPFPTRVDESVFYPMQQSTIRSRLKIPQDRLLVTCLGRLNVVKGWDLVLEAFQRFRVTHPQAMLCFVGDGEDRPALLRKAQDMVLNDAISITGFLPPQAVAEHLNAADLVAFGSHHEGWSVAMLEAIACGKPIVSTRVSGTSDMITPGGNGYIVEHRCPDAFAQAMNNALTLKAAAQVSLNTAKRYRLGNLKHELGQIWSPMA